MTETETLRDARCKLIQGTEALRTGGGTTLSAAECNALLDRLFALELAVADALSVCDAVAERPDGENALTEIQWLAAGLKDV